MPIVATSVDETYQHMRQKLIEVVPDIELRWKAEFVFEINRLKRERNAVILGHNYMEPALYHCVADHVGDSLELSRLAAETDASTIVFCGVRFMAETAKILAPEKTVLLPALEAGCSLAAGITADDVRRLKKQFPGVPVVSYVNTYADVKAESDACCTSSNAAAIVEAFDSDAVIFLPDEYLARNVARQTGRQIIIPTTSQNRTRDTDGCIQHTLIGWNAKCEVHEKFEVDDIRRIRRRYPDVAVLAHPECSPDVIKVADFSGSTSAMIRFVRESSAPRYLLLTECCMGDNIAADNPEKEMLRLCSVRCPHMNEITLEQTLASLRENRHEIEVPPDVLHRARRALDRMIAIEPPRNTVASQQSEGAPICN